MSLPVLKNRMHGIKNTIKITKVMQMIANSKLKDAQSKLHIAQEIKEKIDQQKIIIPRLKNRQTKLLILFGSDTGFCGSINSVVIKKILESNSKTEIIVVGKKLDSILEFQFKKQKNIKIKYFDLETKYFNSELKGKSNADFISFLSNKIINEIISVNSDISYIGVIYNKFKNIISKEFIEEDIIDFESKSSISIGGIETSDIESLKFSISAKLHFYFYSNLCSVLSTRMITMDGASENAKDSYGKLFIQYNKLRQSKINRELLDIVSGLF